MRGLWAPSACALAALTLVGCGGANPQIVEPGPGFRKLREAGGRPSIDEVRDLGSGDVPAHGALDTVGGDGVFGVGEAIWVRGDSFGRQPTVEVGGRPAAVLARTEDGGLVVRVPPQVGAGPQALRVSNEVGVGETTIAIRRLAVALDAAGGRVGFVDLATGGLAALGTPLPAAGATLLQSPDGRAAFVVPSVVPSGGGSIAVLDLGAKGGPRSRRALELPGQTGASGVALAAVASSTPTLAVVRGGDLLLYDIGLPLRPARPAVWALPDEVRHAHPVAIDLAPDGQTLAVLLARTNTLALCSLGNPKAALPVATVSLGIEARASVMVDVAFSPSGDTVWVLSGDTADSRPMGPQPTQAHAVRVGRVDGKLEAKVARRIALPQAGDPVRIATGRSRPVASGAAIRLPPERATVYVTAAVRGAGAPAGHAVFRIGAEDTPVTILQSSERLGAPDVTPDGAWLLVSAAGADGALRVLGVPLSGAPGVRPAVVTVPLAPGSGAAAGATDLRVQP